MIKPLLGTNHSKALTHPVLTIYNLYCPPHCKNEEAKTSLVVQWQDIELLIQEAPGSIPGQGTRSHMLQLGVHMLQLRLSTAKKINKY